MPWTVDDPPRPAKNWTKEEKEKCVAAANAVLREGGSDQDAIFACIHNAGKTKHHASIEFALWLMSDIGKRLQKLGM